MRTLAISMMLFSCATPDRLASDTCGNGVVDPGEDCEPFAGSPGTCAQPGEANACHFTCASNVACPAGYGCSHDGLCRQADSTFSEPKSSPFAGEFEATNIADLDGDGVLDIMTAARFDGVRIAYGSPARDGSFPASTAFPVSYSGVPGVGDFDGDGIADLAIQTEEGLALMRGTADGKLVSLTEPTFTPPRGSFTNGDLQIPMRLDTSSPFQELLHLSYFTDHTSMAFDQPNNLFVKLPVDPNPASFPGDHTFFTFAGPTHYPVADLDVRPSIGGDEIVVGFPNDNVVHVMTAASVHGPGTGLPATLTARVDIPNWPGAFVSPPQVADVNGDGHLDIAEVVDSASGTHVAISFGNGFGSYSAPAIDPEFDQFLNTAGQFATDSNGDFKLVNIAGDARADLVSFESNQIFTRTNAGFQLAGKVPNACVFPSTCEAVTPDLNRDGIPDVVMNSTTGLAIDYGGAAGVFDQAFVLTPGQPLNLRVGDFDGDRVDDVMFLIADGTNTTMYVMWGTTTGIPSTPTTIASWPSLQWVEPALLGPDQTANPKLFTTEDAITDVVVTTNPVGIASPATILLGSASRSLVSSLSLPTTSPIALAGRYAKDAPTDEVFLPEQDITLRPALERYSILDFPTDGGDPANRIAQVDALGSAVSFDANNCAQFARGDFDGDGVDDVVAIESCDPSHSLGGSGPVNAELLVISTGGQEVKTVPVKMGVDQVFIRQLHVADVDGDGHLDLLAVFAGDSGSCTSIPCEAKKSGVVVMFGDGKGGFGASAVIPSPSAGEPLDATALNADGDPELELAVAYQDGVFVFDQSARTFTASAAATLPLGGSFGATIAAADLDGNGTTDLVVNDRGTVHVLLAGAVVH